MHVTDRCNLRCAHCYQESYNSNDPSLATLRHRFDQYLDCFEFFWKGRRRNNRGLPSQVVIMGGEPLVRPDIIDFLDYVGLYQRKWRYTTVVGTNGTIVTNEFISICNKYDITVQISLDGAVRTHNAIRGNGNYQKTLDGIKRMSKAGVKVVASFTAHQGNQSEFAVVASEASACGCSLIWSDRLLPMCSGSTLSMTMPPSQVEDFFCLMASSQNVRMNRALQFLIAGGSPYRCQAGYGLVAVMTDGTLVPCRRMPIPCGNLDESHLLELYYSSPIMNQLRDFLHPDECAHCEHKYQCRGGLRCLSYAVYGDWSKRDPGCFYDLCERASADNDEAQRRVASQ